MDSLKGNVSELLDFRSGVPIQNADTSYRGPDTVKKNPHTLVNLEGTCLPTYEELIFQLTARG